MAGRLIKDVAHEDAQKILDDYWDGLYPVDPVAIANNIGIQVWDADLPIDISGQLVKDGPLTLGQIHLNRHEMDVRRRFTCAHEIGHWMDRQHHEDQEYSFVDYRDASKKPDNAVEWYADHFAANLLMPTDEFTRLRSRGSSIIQLAEFFFVSTAAVRVRLRSLGLES